MKIFTFAPHLLLGQLEVIADIVLKIEISLTGSASVELSADDIRFLKDEYNIKFSSTPHETMCFYSIEVGKAGYGNTPLTALINFLRIKEVVQDSTLDRDKLSAFLNK